MSAAADDLQTATETLAQRIGNFAQHFDLADVPPAVLDYAKLCIADTIGIGFASHRYAFAATSIKPIVALAGSGEFPVVGTDLRLPVRDAAMLNGLLMHGLDFDDTHSGAVTHCSTSAVPLMLASGTHQGATGARALAAYLLALETDARIGKVAKGMLQKIGFHPTGLVGIFGCTVGAAYLGGLDALETARAQGLALSMAAGSLEFLEDGSWTKRLHPGWAASSAITATALASGGFVAPLNAYEGRYGLYSLYLRDGSVDVSKLHDDLGERWEMLKVAIKPYPVCHFNHACIDGMLALREKHNLAPDDIKSITALVHEKQHDVVCRPLDAKRRPQNDYDAKFSLPFAVAAAAVRGRFTLAELYDDALKAPEILAVADRVTCEHMATSRYPEFYSGGLIVETHDGRRLEHVEPINRGADSRALDSDTVLAKFRANVEGHLSDTQADDLWQAVQQLDSAADLDAINRAMGVTGPAAC